jgi:hypothetical protein
MGNGLIMMNRSELALMMAEHSKPQVGGLATVQSRLRSQPTRGTQREVNTCHIEHHLAGRFLGGWVWLWLNREDEIAELQARPHFLNFFKFF